MKICLFVSRQIGFLFVFHDRFVENQREETTPSYDDQFHSPENNLSISIVNNQQTPERLLPTPPEIHSSPSDDESTDERRPVIYIKRILFEEAENYFPEESKSMKDMKKSRKRPRKNRFSTLSKANRKRKRAKETIVLSDDSPIKATENSIITNGHSKGKRRLRPIEAAPDDLSMLANGPEIDENLCSDEYGPITRQIGRDGLLSQTRKTSDNEQDDFHLALHSRPSAATDVSSGPTAIYPDGIEDISNDGVDPPTSPSIPFVGTFPSPL